VVTNWSAAVVTNCEQSLVYLVHRDDVRHRTEPG